MPYFSYVLRNTETGKCYKGHCQDLNARLKEHRYGHTKTTRNERDKWQLEYFEEHATREKAIQRERYYKSAAGRRYLKRCSTDTRSNVPFGTGGERKFPKL